MQKNLTSLPKIRNDSNELLTQCISKNIHFQLISKLLSLRIELVYQIFENLDYPSLLNLRLVSKQLNQIIISLAPFILSKLTMKIDQIKLKLELLQPNILKYNELDQLLMNDVKQELNNYFNLIRIPDISQRKCTPPMIIEVFEYTHILFISDINQKQFTKSIAIEFCMDPQILSKLENFEIASISDQKLSKLQNIYALNEDEIRRKNEKIFYLLRIIKLIIRMRETQYYINKNQEYQLNQFILKINQLIQFFNKKIAQQQNEKQILANEI